MSVGHQIDGFYNADNAVGHDVDFAGKVRNVFFGRHQNALSGRQGDADNVDAGFLLPLPLCLLLFLLYLLRDQGRGVDQVAGLLFFQQVQAFHGAVVNFFKGGFFLFLAGDERGVVHNVHGRGGLDERHRHFFHFLCPFADKIAERLKAGGNVPVLHRRFDLHAFVGVILLEGNFVAHLFDGGV